ncbi:hypothetical protein AB4342_01285 [Vibrio breoganii]
MKVRIFNYDMQKELIKHQERTGQSMAEIVEMFIKLGMEASDTEGEAE